MECELSEELPGQATFCHVHGHDIEYLVITAQTISQQRVLEYNHFPVESVVDKKTL